MSKTSTQQEQKLLAISIAVTVLTAIAGVVFGLMIQSRTVIFDAFYTLIDSVMTLVALGVSRLIARGDDRLFQYGYWHLEPLVALVNGLVLVTACVYAVLEGLNGILSGGRVVDFGPGAIFTGIGGVICLTMAAFIHIRSTNIQSELLRIDARAWLLGGVISLGVCISFITCNLLVEAEYAYLAPYVDPFVLMLLAGSLLPLPLQTVWRATREILLIAPPELDRTAREAARIVSERHGFAAFESHVMKAGRVNFIEIGLVAPSGEMTRSFAELDEIRQEIADELGGAVPGHWLTVDFTADKRWI
ncbi:cation diffusion facilitator family transporter [Magnetospirillum molischianum]|nr:cation transporter [Magnetospirillum molischianum]